MSDGAFLSYLLLLSDSTKTRKSIEMQFDNEEILQQIDASFQRMHIQLDRRLDQLVRQYRRSSRSFAFFFINKIHRYDHCFLLAYYRSFISDILPFESISIGTNN